MTLSTLAAFDPKKLAAMLSNLPEGAIVFGLAATGPQVALPMADKPENEIMGQIVYEGDTISVYCGGGKYHPVYRLREWDGNPVLSVLT